jgi:hypothetical protein
VHDQTCVPNNWSILFRLWVYIVGLASGVHACKLPWHSLLSRWLLPQGDLQQYPAHLHPLWLVAWVGIIFIFYMSLPANCTPQLQKQVRYMSVEKEDIDHEVVLYFQNWPQVGLACMQVRPQLTVAISGRKLSHLYQLMCVWSELFVSATACLQ